MKIVLCGIGDESAGDDCFGPYTIQRISETTTLKKINCGTIPENYLNEIIDLKPDLVVFLDTMRSDSGRATAILVNEELLALSPSSTSTHNLPFSAIYMFLKAHCQADIMLVGVRPNSYQKLTPETDRIAARIADGIRMLDGMGEMDIMKVHEILSSAL